MGVVNVTPDSFSDGGESTRPGAAAVGEEEELRRVIPVIKKLAKILGRDGRAALLRRPADRQVSPTKPVLLSIDTLKPAVARAALAAGASIVNDVGAGREGDSMWKIVSEFSAGYVCMHAGRGAGILPASLHEKDTQAGSLCHYDIVREVGEFFSERLTALLNEAGIAAEQVALDPGIGFGKTVEQNLQLLADLRNFTKWRRPLLVGASRKSFLEKITGATVNERLPASLACATLAVAAGAQIVRTHDVRETVQALRMTEAILDQKTNVA